MSPKKRMEKILNLLINEYPNTKVSLEFNNPFELLVATILSAQTTDKAVNSVLPSLFAAYPDATSMSQASEEEIKEHIKSLGLFNSKARSLVGMSRKLVKDHGGIVPSQMSDLVKLAGVGRKTANVVLGNAFGIPDSGITVDTHVIRLTNRWDFVQDKNAVRIEKALMQLVPREHWVKFTTLAIDHGRKVCVKNPRCAICVLANYCPIPSNREE